MKLRLKKITALVFLLLCGKGFADELDVSGYAKAFLSRSGGDDESQYDQVDRLRLRSRYLSSGFWSAAADYEIRLRWTDADEGFTRGPGRARFMDLDREYDAGDHAEVLHGLDRLWVRYEPDPDLQITVGRQPVSWGTGMIWSPVDLFAAFSPTEIDREEKPGVDVVRTIWSLPSGWSVDVVGEPLDVEEAWSANREDSSLAVRAGMHAGEFDAHAYAGQIQSDQVLGFDFAGYAGDAGVHGEWMQTWVEEDTDRDYARGVVGADYGFAAAWNPYVLLEYFYNGLGEPDPADFRERLSAAPVKRVIERGTAYNIGRDYLGGTVRVQPSALVTLSATAIANLHDGSMRQLASATWSVAQDLDVIAGLDLGVGDLPGEFTAIQDETGEEVAVPDLYYLYAKYYF